MPFAGGAVGYSVTTRRNGLNPHCETIKRSHSMRPTDAVWMFYRTVIAFDRVKQRLEIVSIVFTEEAGGSHERLRELYDEAVARTLEVEKTDLRSASAAVTAANSQRERRKHFAAIKLDHGELSKKVCGR